MERLADGAACACQQTELGRFEGADPAWASNDHAIRKRPDRLTGNPY